MDAKVEEHAGEIKAVSSKLDEFGNRMSKEIIELKASNDEIKASNDEIKASIAALLLILGHGRLQSICVCCFVC